MTSRLACLACLLVPASVGAAATPANIDALLARESLLMSAASKKTAAGEDLAAMARLRAEIAGRKFAAGDPDGAAAYLQNSLGLDPAHADRWTMLGDLYQVLGVPGAALLAQSAYEKALGLEPARRQTRIRLAAAYLHAGRFGRAVDEFETVMADEKGAKPDEEFLQPLAAAYAAAQEHGRGARFFERMAKQGGGPRVKLAAAILNWDSPDELAPMRFLKRRSAKRLIKEVEAEAAGTPIAVYAVRLRHSWENAEAPR